MSTQRFFENKSSLELLKTRLEEELMDIGNEEDFHVLRERIDEINKTLENYNDISVVDF